MTYQERLTLRGETLTRYLLDSTGWDHFISDRMGNDLFINDPERADRCHEAAQYGADGSTHHEQIEDQRDFAKLVFYWNRELPNCFDAVEAYLDSVEQWHEQNGSLWEEVG